MSTQLTPESEALARISVGSVALLLDESVSISFAATLAWLEIVCSVLGAVASIWTLADSPGWSVPTSTVSVVPASMMFLAKALWR